MKRVIAGVLATVIMTALATHAGAQTTSTDALPPVQPPPDMDATAIKPVPPEALPPKPSNVPVVPLANSDEEARTAAAAEARASAERAKALVAPPTPALPGGKPLDSPGLPPDVQKAAEATELPVVTVRQNGNERVEEYRKKGILYFVRVVTPEGPPRYYVDNRSEIPADIRQLSGPSGHVEPVYFKLFEWK